MWPQPQQREPLSRLFARTLGRAVESYFGPRCVKGKAGRGAGKNTFVFGICKRHGMVYTEVVEDCTETTTLAAISRREDLRSVIHSDGFKSYDSLVDMGYKKHVRVDHTANEFSSHTIRGNHSKGQLARHELLGVRQYTTGVVQRNKPEHLLLAPQRMRVPFQPPWPKSEQNFTYTLLYAQAQLVMTQFNNSDFYRLCNCLI